MQTDNFVFKKSPDAVLDFSINWTNLLDGESIVDSSWSLDVGPSVVSTSISGVYTTIWVSGGEPGTSYCGKNIIQTSNNLVDSATFSLFIS